MKVIGAAIAISLLFGGAAQACGTPAYALYYDADGQPRPENEAVLTEAALNWMQSPAPGDRSVRISAHTDTLGDAAANQKRSEEQAAFVRDSLFARGVFAAAVSVEAWGESHPAVATADEVAEPLNRVVFIYMDLASASCLIVPPPAPKAQ